MSEWIENDPATLLGRVDVECPKQPGVSVIVCCHNSIGVLPATLASLARQIVTRDLRWEIVVVDNGSTDGTGDLARSLRPANSQVLLRVVPEAQLGLAYARLRGVASASYEYLAFVDDDNRLESDWVQRVFEVLREHGDVAVVGSVVEPEFETSRPEWFESVSNLYAISPTPPLTGDITALHVPCGAGLCVRHAALTDAQRKGFRSISVGRRGGSLAAGEDSELVYCLRLAGWRVWADPRLRLRHFLPSRRLHWAYARRLAYWSAHATAERDALVYACKPPRQGVTKYLRRVRESWGWQVASAVCRLFGQPAGIVKALRQTPEGDPDVLRVELLRGRAAGLLVAWRWYGRRASEVRQVMASASRRSSGALAQEPHAGREIANA